MADHCKASELCSERGTALGEVRQWIAAFLAVAAIVGFSIPLAYPARNQGKVKGVVTNREGKVVAGASVRVTNPDRGLTVAVITQSTGRYETPNLPTGKYTAQAIGGGLQSDIVTVGIDGKKSASSISLVLTSPADFKKTASMSDFATLMPESEAKTLIISLCTDCHRSGLQEVFLTRKNRDGWSETLAKMRNHPYGFYRSLEASQQQQSLILDYLTQHFAPGDASINIDALPKSWVTGPAARGVFTELRLPEGTDPHDVAVDSAGIGWISESGPGNIGRYDPRTFAYTRVPLPDSKSSSTAVAVDAQDRVWVADTPHARLVRYDPKTETFDVYPLPKPSSGNTNIVAIRFSADGDVWASEIVANQIVRLDPATKEIRTYQVPAGVSAHASVNPAGIAIGGDKAVWFTEERSNKIAKIDSNTAEITEYDVPTPGAVPRRMASDAAGNLWFGEFGGLGKLAMLDYRSAQFMEFPTPTKYSGAYSVSVDGRHNLVWVNEMIADQIARFDPRTGTFVEYEVPTRNALVRRIEVDPSRPDRVWFAGSNTDTVGFLDVTN